MASRVTALKRGVTGLAALCLGAGMMVVATPANAAAPAGRTSFPGSVPSFATAAADAGPAADTTVEGEVFLSLRDTLGAAAFATAVSTPGNAKYGKYLTPAAWIAKYSPTQADFDAVKNYLVASGETIYATPASRQYIVFRGPASTDAAAFGTRLHNYRTAGKVVSAPSSAPTLPASIASKVTGISLGNARAQLTRPNNVKQGSAATSSLKTPTSTPARKTTAAAPAAATDSTSCSSYWAQYSNTVPTIFGQTSAPTFICGYLPKQLRQSANINPLINSGHDGTGQTVAIVDAYASPTIVQDTNDYMLSVGSPLLTKFQQLSPGTFQDEALCQYPSGWQAEEAIDVQSAHSIAPGSKILYSGGFNCGGGLDIAVSKILDNKLANIISNSYGSPEAYYSDDQVRGETDIDYQAAGEGIGLYYSSGDGGDNAASLGFPDPSFISGFATSVGGTSLGIGLTGQNVFQTGWGDVRDQIVDGQYTTPVPGDMFRGGAGGGRSYTSAEPAYQRGVVPPSLATGEDGTRFRVQPDVGDLADPYTGFQIAIRPIIDDTTLATGDFEYDTYGGTSLASPIVAAKVALIQQVSGRTIGFANPLFYKAALARNKTVNDVRAPATPQILYFLRATDGAEFTITTNLDTSLHTTTNYDDVTGVGTLNVARLAEYVSKL